MATLTRNAYIKNEGPQSGAFDNGPHLGGVIKFVCTRSALTNTSVSVTAYYYLGFGDYAASGVSWTGYTVTAYAWSGSSSGYVSSTGASATVSTGTWSCTSNTESYFSAHSSDSNIDVKTKPTQKTGTIGSWTISNWTSGTKALYFRLNDNGNQTIFSVNASCPDYSSNYIATVVANNDTYGTVTGGGSYTPNTSITITATPRPGYYFTKWAYSNGWSGSNTNASVTFTITTSGTATATFGSYYARLRYNVNGGTVTTGTDTTQWRATSAGRLQRSTDSGSTWADVTHDVYSYNVVGDSTTNMWNVGTPPITKTGYHVVGTEAWNTQADGTGINLNQDYSSSSTTNAVTAKRLNGGSALTSNITVDVYPKWVLNTWTFTFDGNGNTGGSMANDVHTYGVAKNLPPNQFTKTGYKFSQWKYARTAGDLFYNDEHLISGSWTQTNGNTYTLVAQWEVATTDVTFDPNGGSLDANGNWGTDKNTTNPHTCTLQYGASAYYAQGKATRDGYTFAGWNTKADGTGHTVWNADGSWTIAGNYWRRLPPASWATEVATLTVYAKWIKSNVWGHANNTWNNMNNMWTCLNGEWKQVIAAWAKVNEEWRPIFGSTNEVIVLTPCTHANAQTIKSSFCLGEHEWYCCDTEGEFQNYTICPDCGMIYITPTGTTGEVLCCPDCSETEADWQPYLNKWLQPSEFFDIANRTEYTNIYSG